MIDTKFRGPIQPIFDFLARPLIKIKITPDIVTWLAFLTGIGAGALIGIGKMIIGIVLLWLSGLLDVLDGTIARLTRKSTIAGAYMDLILDRMVESAVILGFEFFRPENYFVYILFLISVIFNFSTFVVAGALFKNEGSKSMHYDLGITERTETFIVFTLMAIYKESIFEILMIFNVLIFITGIIRFIRVIKYSRQ